MNLSKKEISLPQTTAILGLHVLALFAFSPKYFTWEGWWICLFLIWLSIWVGIGVCYHRLLTHASFKTPWWFRYLLTILGALSWQGGPLTWVGKHRKHHQFSDKEGDPHSPRDGFAWAHMLWVLFKTSEEEKEEVLRITKDLQREGWMVFIDKFFWLPQVVLAILLFCLGFLYGGFDVAFGWVIWGIGVRTVVGYHLTWFVNSASHTWGYQDFPTGDDSKNLWWVALLVGGEGWHNYHHYDQTSASHGCQRWYEIDPTYWTIKLFSLVGLAERIVPPKVGMFSKV